MFRKKITFIVSLSLIFFISHAAQQCKRTPSSTSSTQSDDSACGLRGIPRDLFFAAQFSKEAVWQQNKTKIEGREHYWSSNQVTLNDFVLAHKCAVKKRNPDAAHRLSVARYEIEDPVKFQVPKTKQEIGQATIIFGSGFATAAFIFGANYFFGGNGGSDS